MIEVNRKELRDDVAICQGVIGRIHGVEFPSTDEGQGQDELCYVVGVVTLSPGAVTSNAGLLEDGGGRSACGAVSSREVLLRVVQIEPK